MDPTTTTATSMKLYRGTLVHTPRRGDLEILQDYLVAVDETTGLITHCASAQTHTSTQLLTSTIGTTITTIPKGHFLLPTFTDLHLHAPQYLYQGNGLDLPLMEWLDRYALRAEARLDADTNGEGEGGLAERVYRRLAARLKENGTGAVVLFGTIKEETNLVLARCMLRAGIRAFVGKLSMDIDISTPNAKNPLYVEPSASESLATARSFVNRCRGLYRIDVHERDKGALEPKIAERQPLVQPVLTPRFVPTCTDELLRGLGELAREGRGLKIQSHMAEAKDQMEWVRAERGIEDVEVFNKAGLLTDHTIQAHCTFLSVPDDVTLLAQRGTTVAHCPLSNCYFSPGKPFPLREALDAGVKVGLGTDIAGGYSVDVMNAMRQAVVVSRMRQGEKELKGIEGKSVAIDWKEAMYLGTRGGMVGLGLAGGEFCVGAPFDVQEIALFDKTSGNGVGPLDFFDIKEGVDVDMVEKWWCIGDTRNRVNMWIDGKSVFPN